jgi:hypothetical protein
MQESGLKVTVEWLHFELDFAKSTDGQKQFWPGVEQNSNGIWTASPDAVLQYVQIAALLTPIGASHYMSRSGLHCLVPIQAIPYEHFLAYAHAWLQTILIPKLAHVQRKFPLHLDNSCIEPSRLHYLPRINKPGQGKLHLPLEIGTGERTTLPEPTWAPQLSTNGQFDLQLYGHEKLAARQFADRWLKSHATWLSTALPGTGRNARLYAIGGDIRQFESAGVLDRTADQWLQWAVALGRSAPVREVHNAEGAVMNGYAVGTGSGSIAAMMLHIRKQKQRTDARANLAAALRLTPPAARRR